MVVCRCRKATKLYCFVHKAPVCGDCITFPEHQLCVVKTYSDWVVDGDYDWPPKCGLCQEMLQETDDMTRLGCFHVLHSKCLETHLQSFPVHTAPAGYICPLCTTSIWPPKLIKEASSGLHSKLKQTISQSGLATNLLGNDVTALSSAQRVPPLESTAAVPAEENDLAASGSGVPLIKADSVTDGAIRDIKHGASSSTSPRTANLESVPAGTHVSKSGPQVIIQLPNGAMARKHRDNSNPSAVEFDDDEDGSHRKYSGRGPLHQRLLRSLLPIWSPTLQGLPVTAPSYKRDGPGSEDTIDGRSRRKQRNSGAVNTKRIFFCVVIMSCMATVILLYHSLGFGSSATEGTVK